ncbi:site-specific DNA-methyltransferase [Acinetobacter wuhouensis]|uniref:site-specific DNA-methyltransferase n=1 Tax=Acinetobacter wuhouensis TaxID=1879050 RepID=UPI001023E2BD|nr:site-specific DNA-methyltransferase [Acinetobacter wuhouensis]RZG67602.1 site-specific DNA-methyltransferase [Acinetobacter wuhouensis]
MSDNSLKKGRYTRYSNKIGLYSTSQDRIGFLNNNTDVVLSFPFKDTVLEAGMSKEDSGREERFLHLEVDGSDIDTLFEPKVLTNIKYSGIQEFRNSGIQEFRNSGKAIEFFDENGNLQQNLLIKGNNLLALHSLKQKFSNEVKCIFIDPPYYFIDTKPADTFAYNSNFKLSSWLIFMKNRLEVAKELLKENGIIFITISDDGAHYLKVLADDIFGRENFIADVIWQSRKSISSDGLLSVSSTHVLTYAKDKTAVNKADFKLALDIEGFDLQDELGKYKIEPFDAPNVRENLEYKITNPNNGEVYTPPNGRHWRTTEKEYLSLLERNRIQFGSKGLTKPQLKVYLEDAIEAGKGKAASTLWSDVTPDTILWTSTDTTTNATKHQQAMFGDVVFENPKPENLIQRAIELSTDENDIVLDYHLGSGTTCAVAHKMGRRWIGIEQMDYIEDITKERLKKVIEGEQGGISKAVNWQGGGSFVYFELKKYNQYFVDKIMVANSKGELDEVYREMAKNAFLKFWFDKDEFEKDENFRSLDLDQRKELLIGILDENQLYLNHADMRDSRYHVTDEEMSLTDLFYGAHND